LSAQDITNTAIRSVQSATECTTAIKSAGR
jgi:hypothetical protein